MQDDADTLSWDVEGDKIGREFPPLTMIIGYYFLSFPEVTSLADVWTAVRLLRMNPFVLNFLCSLVQDSKNVRQFV